MRLGTILLASVTVLVTAASLIPSGSPQSKLSVTNLYDHPFDVDFASGQLIRLDLRSGEFRIVGRDGDKISIRATGPNVEKAREMTVTFKHFGTTQTCKSRTEPSRTDLPSPSKFPKSRHCLCACRSAI